MNHPTCGQVAYFFQTAQRFNIRREDLLKWGKEVFVNWKVAMPADAAIVIPTYEEINFLKVQNTFIIEHLIEVKKEMLNMKREIHSLVNTVEQLSKQLTAQTNLIEIFMKHVTSSLPSVVIDLNQPQVSTSSSCSSMPPSQLFVPTHDGNVEDQTTTTHKRNFYEYSKQVTTSTASDYYVNLHTPLVDLYEHWLFEKPSCVRGALSLSQQNQKKFNAVMSDIDKLLNADEKAIINSLRPAETSSNYSPWQLNIRKVAERCLTSLYDSFKVYLPQNKRAQQPKATMLTLTANMYQEAKTKCNKATIGNS